MELFYKFSCLLLKVGLGVTTVVISYGIENEQDLSYSLCLNAYVDR